MYFTSLLTKRSCPSSKSIEVVEWNCLKRFRGFIEGRSYFTKYWLLVEVAAKKCGIHEKRMGEREVLLLEK